MGRGMQEKQERAGEQSSLEEQMHGDDAGLSEISPAASAKRLWGVTNSHQKHRKPLQPSHPSDNGLGPKHPLLVAKCWENIAQLFTQGLLLASQL